MYPVGAPGSGWLGRVADPQKQIVGLAGVLGRLTFWIGYLIYPMGRAFGMVLTAVPTFAAYGWLVWRLLARE
jgi:hypothetical protein